MLLIACGSEKHTVITESVNGYRTITEKDELCSFSFEFSDFYEVDGPRVVNKDTVHPFTCLSLLAPEKTTQMILPDIEKSGIATREVTYVPALSK
jgi:hypothetical protein